MSTKDDVIALLPKLSKADLGAVISVARLLGAPITIVAQARADLPHDYLIAGIKDYLVSRVMISGAYELVVRTNYKQYQEKRPDLDGFLNKLASSAGTQGKRYMPQIAFLCAGALADWLEQRGIFSVGAMLSQIDKIPEAMDNAFPDYIASGMFGFLLLKHREG